MKPIRSLFRRPSIGPAWCALALVVASAAGSAPDAAAAPPPVPDNLAVSGPALLRDWVAPVYPPAELKARHGGLADIRAVIDATGKLVSARALDDSDAAFVASGLAAVKTWTFTPALDNGKPVACCLDIPVMYSPAVGRHFQRPDHEFSFAPKDPAKPVETPGGDYPPVLADRMISGAVKFAGIVDPSGHVQQPRILGASQVEFVLPAFEAMRQWKFRPAMQGDLAIPDRVEGSVTFDSPAGKPEEVLAANAITAPDGKPPAVTPEPLVVADPVWPLDALLKGEGGSATVEFTVTETGFVRDLKVRAASQPAFGQALEAALEGWHFSRPFVEDHAVTVPLVKRVDFKAIPADATDKSDPVVRLVQALRHNEVGGPKGLDARLVPIYRVPPVYPLALRGQNAPAGQAMIEFVIDREGRARLPRIVSASREEFGWAAATAVNQWIFQPPHRGGAPVDVKVRIPFDFQPQLN